MGRKLMGVYTVLVEGVCCGLSGHELYDFITERCKQVSPKRLCRASTMAMSDPRIENREVLETIHMLATDRRVRCVA
jgi:hypothetical protein